MSLRGEAWAWEAPPWVDREQLLILVQLGKCHNEETDLCCPGNPFLARKCRMHRATVYRCLQSLKDGGLISWKPGGGRKSNTYVLHGVSRGYLPPEIGGNEQRDHVPLRGRVPHGQPSESYPHPSQTATGAVAQLATFDEIEGSHAATGAVASCATGAVASCATQYGIEGEYTKPREPVSAAPDTRIPDELRALGMQRAAELRASLTAPPPPEQPRAALGSRAPKSEPMLLEEQVRTIDHLHVGGG